MPNSRRILVLDANQRSALAAVRSLGKMPDALVYAADSSTEALAGTSRFCRKYFQHPSPLHQYEQFADWLIRTVREEAIDFLLPMTEVSSRSALTLRSELGTCILPFADLETIFALSDKWRLIELAGRIDVPCPASEYMNDADDLHSRGHKQFPIVLKPCLSRIFHNNQWINTGVHIAHNEDELDRLLREKSYLREHPFIVQEFIPGHGAGIFALYDHGLPVAFFAHRRLREKPPSGGVSVLSESVVPPAELRALAQSLLDHVGWHGVAMIEFRIGLDRKPYLMEVNTRFWGSLQLAIDAGVDFPRLLFEAHTGGIKNQDHMNYRAGLRLRWLLGDVDNLYLTLRGSNSLGHKLSSLIRFLTPHPFVTRHEINRGGDLQPAWFELRQYVHDLLGRS